MRSGGSDIRIHSVFAECANKMRAAEHASNQVRAELTAAGHERIAALVDYLSNGLNIDKNDLYEVGMALS